MIGLNEPPFASTPVPDLSTIEHTAPVSALAVLGTDFTFPRAIEGQPTRLSDFGGLQIGRFRTSDDVELAYWVAGEGDPLVFIPGWSANGALYVYLMALLSRHYRVHVLDVRNQGLSQRVSFGTRISRFAMDLKEFAEHLQLDKAHYCGWSMGASVLWAYIDLFGTKGVRKLAFIDQAPSIYCHADWTEQERLDAGAFTSSPERMIASYTQMMPVNMLISGSRVLEHATQMDSPYYANALAFAQSIIIDDMSYTGQVLFDHATNDWRDVIRSKIDVPTAIFSGEYSDWLHSQRWMASVIPDASLFVYSKADHGDHFLALKNPLKFSSDLHGFLMR